MSIRTVKEWDHGRVIQESGRLKVTWLEGVKKDMKYMDLHEMRHLIVRDEKGRFLWIITWKNHVWFM